MTKVDHTKTVTIPEIFLIFLRLGLTSFGGPIAHIGYFRQEFVERRKWLDEHAYADLVALCQFLPGPASSQIGIALGLSRGGFLGQSHPGSALRCRRLSRSCSLAWAFPLWATRLAASGCTGSRLSPWLWWRRLYGARGKRSVPTSFVLLLV